MLSSSTFFSDAFDDMYQVPDDQRQNKPTPESKHKEKGIKRQKSDDVDRKKMEEKLRSLTHPLEQYTQVFNLVNGRMATPDINFQDCKDIGEQMLKEVCNDSTFDLWLKLLIFWSNN